MSLGPFQPYAHDLAPGDRSALDGAWTSFEVAAIRSPDDPMLDDAWQRLWREFGERGEMERREVIRERLAWNLAATGGHALDYEMLVVRSEGRMVAVRDHTVIVTPTAGDGSAGPGVVVHLSHVVVEPEVRGRGLAAWLRAMPIAAARRSLERMAGLRDDARSRAAITLVAEMEHDDGVTPDVRRRLRSYARAGFRVVDPQRFAYAQPDFRRPEEIDRTGEKAVPLCLVVRRVGREHENSIAPRELVRIAGALHAMYGAHVDERHMQRVRESVSAEAIGGEAVSLLVPGAAPADDRRILK